MKNLLEDNKVPIGMSMAFAQDLEAMNRFSNLSKDEQQQIAHQAHQIHSKHEMQAFVSSIGIMDSGR